MTALVMASPTVRMTGPMNRKVKAVVMRTERSGVTMLSIMAGTTLCRRFSMMDMKNTATMTGRTVPW